MVQHERKAFGKERFETGFKKAYAVERLSSSQKGRCAKADVPFAKDNVNIERPSAQRAALCVALTQRTRNKQYAQG